MGDLLDGYLPATTMGIEAWDEMFEAPGVPRAAVQALHDVLAAMPPEEFDERASARDRGFTDRGITFQLSGKERPWPLDLIPRVIPDEEWQVLESGVAQRVRALEAFLADVYGTAKILDDGILPRRLVTTSAHFHRDAYAITPPNGVRIHVAGIDVVRGADGRFYVLEDNVRCPSGISYVVENRKMLSRIFPELFSHNQVRPVDNYPSHLLAALRAAAPENAEGPTVVVLTPGIYNSAYFEHSFLARQMGVELVEGRDLVARNDVVYMRTTEGEQRVDVIYRRIDDDWLDPLHFRTESVVGCPGLLNAARAGNVTIANAVGNGVADDKLFYTYVPDIIRYYLGEEPILPNVTTYRLEDPEQLHHALGQLDRLVLKPVSGSGGYGILIGPQASDEELAQAKAEVLESPRDWIAQELVALSTAPTRVGGDRLAPRHLDLRPFAVNDGTKVWVAPGGLTRVALPEGGMVVNSSQGGGSKDTWVTYRERVAQPVLTPLDGLAAEEEGNGPAPAPLERLGGSPRSGRAQETGPGSPGEDSEKRKQQHQQQQQSGGPAC